MLPVMVDPPCFLSLVESSIEVFNRETTGMLIGHPRKRTIRGKPERVMALDVAFPIQTAARRVFSVEPGNGAAFHRARSAIDSLGYRIVGEFHSHTNNHVALSRDDLAYARNALLESGADAWLELILGVRKKTYASPKRVGWIWRDYHKKAGCTVRITEDTGFDVTIGAFWVYHDAASGRVKWSEETVFIPWAKHYWVDPRRAARNGNGSFLHASGVRMPAGVYAR
ncbi:MAG TPA: Mov34/MPN/PAD-1 family protein [Candidatus Thermoplasmatota archaeon]|nr:Mov34/MPN/PAD-1 family protein [Candidatus Thermoplasmatota archaeon]